MLSQLCDDHDGCKDQSNRAASVDGLRVADATRVTGGLTGLRSRVMSYAVVPGRWG